MKFRIFVNLKFLLMKISNLNSVKTEFRIFENHKYGFRIFENHKFGFQILDKSQMRIFGKLNFKNRKFRIFKNLNFEFSKMKFRIFVNLKFLLFKTSNLNLKKNISSDFEFSKVLNSNFRKSQM